VNPYLTTTAMAAAAAAVGSVGTRPGSAWYRALDKPSWQPPPAAFPLVWTPLYASIAWATGRATAATRSERDRRRMLVATAADLVANAGWSWAFFAARSPASGLVVLGALNASNAVLVRESARHDRRAAAALAPYAAWCGFATALNLALWRRNRGAQFH
jgi:tryptophan-rich sensory protein